MIIGIDGNEANVERRVGSNQYAYELLKALKEENTKHGIVIYLRDKPLSDMPNESQNWKYRVFGPKKFWTQWRLPLDLYFHKPRPNVFFSPGHYAPRFSPVPVVVSIMDLGYLKFPQHFTKKDLYQLTLWTSKSIQVASHILAISQSTKNDIIEAYGVPEEKITVTYPGYDKKRFNLKVKGQESEKARRKCGILGDYILFLSTLKPSKNIEGLLEAFYQMTRSNPVRYISLVIAGKKGWMYESIYKKVEELGLGKKVIFTDFVAEDEVPGLMAGAKVFVMPSFWEGFGIPALEAMATGVPTVVSNVGSLPEVVGEAGIIVEPYKPEDIARGIKEALARNEELKERGLTQIKKFSWVKCARNTLEVLEKYGCFS